MMSSSKTHKDLHSNDENAWRTAYLICVQMLQKILCYRIDEIQFSGLANDIGIFRILMLGSENSRMCWLGLG